MTRTSPTSGRAVSGGSESGAAEANGGEASAGEASNGAACAGSKDSPANKKCVYQSSKDAKADNTATASKTVAFCCEKCKGEFEKDPKKYLPKVK